MVVARRNRTRRPTHTYPGRYPVRAHRNFLIALGDAGQSGTEIGCEDSAIPVEVQIQPTVAPLTAAYDELLRIDQRFYGQSGLYNALHRSDLTVAGVDIANGLATVNLSGALSVAGTCDVPRIRAQLQQTALQYANVDDVNIFIDGTSLDDILAAR